MFLCFPVSVMFSYSVLVGKSARENFVAREGNKLLKKKETSFSFDILLSSPENRQVTAFWKTYNKLTVFV